MSRSVWKGPFVDMYLLKKAESVKNSGRNDVIKTWSRRSTIIPEFVGLTFGVHNGKKHIHERVIVSIGDPQKRFAEDPVRSLRAIRFSNKLNFKIDTKNGLFARFFLTSILFIFPFLHFNLKRIT